MVISIVGLLGSVVLVSLEGGEDRATVGKAMEFSHTMRVSLGADLVGEWKFDDESDPTADSSGNNNGADLVNFSSSWTGGVFGKALQFDGLNDYVRVINFQGLNFATMRTNYTIGLWFKTACNNCGIFRVNGSGHDRHIYLNNGNICQRVWSEQIICTTNQNYADNNWHYVVQWVKKGTGQRIYVDGEEVASGTKDESNFDWAAHADIGFSDDAASDYFNGIIDEVRIYNRALYVLEIQEIYAQGAKKLLAGQ